MITKFIYADELAKVTQDSDTGILKPGDIVHMTGPEVEQVIDYVVLEARMVKRMTSRGSEQHVVIKKHVVADVT